MVKNRREVKPTPLQKYFILFIAIILIGSFIMVVLHAFGVVSDVQIFHNILFSSLSAIFGFLLGNNVKMNF